MTKPGKDVWRLLTVLLFMVLIIASCNENPGSRSNTSVSDDQFLKDTIIIHRILKEVTEKSFSSVNQALANLDSAENLANKIGYNEKIAEIVLHKGNLKYVQNKYKEALDNYSVAMKLSEERNDSLLKAQCLERMASVYLSIGDDHMALKLYYEALPLFEQISNKEGMAKVYNIVGVSKTSQKEYDSALTYFQKAIALNEETGNQTGLIHNNGNLAFMYFSMGNTEKAKEVYLSLLPELIKYNDSINQSVICYHLSMFYEALSQPDSTLFYLYKSRAVSEEIADTSLLVTLYGKIGEIYLDRRQYDSASYLLTRSAQMSKAIEDFVTARQVLRLLISVDTIKGNFKSATKRYAETLIAADSVYNQRLRNNLEASELTYENQKKSNLIEIQKLELQSANRQKQFLFFIFFLSVLISLLLFILFIFHKKNNKRKQELLAEKLKINELQLENIKQTEEINKLRIKKIEGEIKIKEHEQVSSALAIEQKNELLGIINKKFTEAIQDKGSISLSELNGLVSTIKSQVRDSNDTDLFNQKFNQLHQHFYSNLQQSHPNLTRTELKFCAYLKLNLSGSQIASIQNVTPEAIRKTRYRIRKKINLSTTDSLEDYISRF
jgi:tetratricopeptide (TPR) repeat protein/DNA-binding CsgD family transcriptional regulator